MGITINWRLAQERQYIKATLDDAEAYAKKIKDEAGILGVEVEVRRLSEQKLFVEVGGCETLGLDFKTMEEWEQEAGNGWEYENETLKDLRSHDTVGEHYQKYPGQKLVWCSNFCKTQFAGNVVEHKYVADILKMVAVRCRVAVVRDEGDYYHSGRLEDASGAIEEVGGMIGGLVGQLQGLGYEGIKGGETKVKKVKRA